MHSNDEHLWLGLKGVIFCANKAPLPSLLFFSRVAIASMHYNENNARMQATTATGKLRFAMRFRKSQSGEASLSAIKEPPTYGKDRVASELLVASLS